MRIRGKNAMFTPINFNRFYYSTKNQQATKAKN
jgi:hypothetical protein